MDVQVKRFGSTNMSFRSFMGTQAPLGGEWTITRHNGAVHLTVLTALAALLAIATAWIGWHLLVTWWYRVRGEPAERLWAVAGDGWRIAVYHRPAARRRFREPV